MFWIFSFPGLRRWRAAPGLVRCRVLSLGNSPKVGMLDREAVATTADVPVPRRPSQACANFQAAAKVMRIIYPLVKRY